MSSGSPRIVLNMIVKNEGAVIERCLERVKPFIDAWVIVDTGSTDDTKEKIAAALGDLPGVLYERSWKNHGDNRNEALDLAREEGMGDFFLFIDADDTWEVGKGFAFPELLPADGYMVRIRQNGTAFKRVVLVRASKPWRYSGTAHAVLTCPEPHTLGHVKDVHIQMHSDGARRAGVNPQKKYEDDIQEFLRQLDENPNNTRAMFYLAQSYRDCKQFHRAAHWYRQRATHKGGFYEERFSALLEYAKIQRHLKAPFDHVRDSFLEAHRERPHRAEPLLALAEIHRDNGDPAQGFVYASAAKELPWPEKDLLFVEERCYTWRALDEFAMAAWRIGLREVAVQAHEQLLKNEGLPVAQQRRVRTNLRYCAPPSIPAIQPNPQSVLEQTCLTILTGRRLFLLRQTLESLPAQVLEEAHVVVYVNGEDTETQRYVESLDYVDRLIYHPTPKPEPIGDAVSRLVQDPLRESGRSLWFHLEDDWACQAESAAFLVEGARILQDPHVGQVRFRLAAEPTMKKHMVTGTLYSWNPGAVQGVSCLVSDVHYTFNPSLVRAQDVERLFPATHEVEAARRFYYEGWKVAQLDPGAFRHLGNAHSLRRTLKRA